MRNKTATIYSLLIASLLFVTLLAAITPWWASCLDSVGPGRSVVRLDSAEGRMLMNRFAVSLEEAQAIALEDQSRLPEKAIAAGMAGHTVAFLIVDDEYVFSRPHQFKYLLRGYYVNGETGEVRFVDTPEYVCP